MLRLLVLPLYPLLVHLAVLRQSSALAGAALLVLVAIGLAAALAAGRRAAWLALAGAAAAIAALSALGAAPWLLYLPPLLFPLAVFHAFASSLRPGRTPLVGAIATSIHGELTPELAAYTRAVTWLWTLVVGGLLLANLAFTLAGSREGWSLFTNGGDYALIAAVFLLEYAWRRLRFRRLEQPRFADYLRRVLAHRPGLA